jgi:hypothetical protein
VDSSALELYLSINSGEQRIIPAHTHVGAREEFRSALPNYDRACFDGLAAIPFNASVLRIAVSAVPRRALSLFMCHNMLPLIANQNLPKFQKRYFTVFMRIVQRNLKNFRAKFQLTSSGFILSSQMESFL